MLKSGLSAGKPMIDGRLCFSQMSFSDGKSVECIHLAALMVRLRPGPEVVFDILPVIAALVIRAERTARIVPAMNHAILATRITSNTIDDAIFIPIYFRKHLLIAGIMAIRH